MIELPARPAPADAQPALMDLGGVLRGATGSAALRIDRAGNHFTVQITWPPMVPDVARVFIARLQRSKREGLRLPYPLMGQGQGSPGAPVVDGASAAGTSLPVRSLTPGYVAKEGYWLSVVDVVGAHYLHVVAATVAADASGDATLTVEPPLRTALADGAAVHLAKPMIEGFVTSDVSWPLPRNRLVSLSVTIEEAA